MEILDLIAKVSWETNTAELNAMNKELKQQDKALEELRVRGQKLEEQMRQTSDPKKQAAYSQELAKTKASMQSILDVQKKQTDATKALTDQQKQLYKEISKVTDPIQYRKMLNELAKVEQKLQSLNTSAKDLPSKLSTVTDSFGSIGKSIAGGFGLSAGQFGLEGIVSSLKSFVESANQEFIDAENTTLRFKNTLKGLGQEKYFDELTAEADMLAKSIGYLDNDDIVSAQEKMLTYGKLSKAEISKLLPVIIDLAARMGTDVPSATETMINIMEGRGGATLRQLGLTIKDANTTTERLGVIFEELGPKIAGSAEAVKNSSEGMQRVLKQQVADLEESIGESTIQLQNYFLSAYAGFLGLLKKLSQSEEDERSDMSKKLYNERANEAKKLNDQELDLEKSLLATKVADIKTAQKIIWDLEAENAKKGLQYIGAIKISANNKEIQAQKDFIARREAETKAIIDESNSRSQRAAEDAEVKKKRAAEDAAAAKKDINKKSDNEAEARQKAELARLEALRKQVEADRIKLDEFTMTSDEREMMALIRKYDEQMALAKNNAELQLKIRENYLDALVQIQRKHEFTMDKLGSADVEQTKENTKEKSEAQAKAGIDFVKQLQKETLAMADKKKTEKEQRQADIQASAENLINLGGIATEQLSIEQQKIEGLMSLQSERIEKAKADSEASVKIEQDRYDALVEKRRQFEQEQRIIDAGVIVANQALAISGAIRQITEASGVTPAMIIANGIAIAGSITASILAIKNAFADVPAFRKGGYTGDGNPDSVSTELGNKPYKYHKREFVMDEQLTSKHRDLFEGLHKRQLVVQKLDDGQFYLGPRMLNTDAMVANHEAIKQDSLIGVQMELAGIKELLSKREVSVNNNFDANGFGTEIATQLGRVHIKNLGR